jgi:hypothetical protein
VTDDRAEEAFRTALATRATEFQPESRELPTARHRRWPAVLAAAILVLVVVLVGAFRPHGGHEVPSPVGLPDGWRWESRANVMVGVPESWGYALSPAEGACPSSRTFPSPGYVDSRPPGGGNEADVACAPAPPQKLTAPHLSFSDDLSGPELPVPSGWLRLVRSVGAIRLQVTMDAAHRALADQILATAHVVSKDQNGCAATSPFQDPSAGRPIPPFDVTSLHGVDSIAVCQYQLGVAGPGLVASHLLTGRAADAELHALQTAPTGGGPTRPRNCDGDRGPTGSTLLLTSGGRTHEMYAVYSGCRANGIDDGTHLRALTTSSCSPLFGPRVIDTEGIESAFRRCVPEPH